MAIAFDSTIPGNVHAYNLDPHFNQKTLQGINDATNGLSNAAGKAWDLWGPKWDPFKSGAYPDKQGTAVPVQKEQVAAKQSPTQTKAAPIPSNVDDKELRTTGKVVDHQNT